MVEAIIEQVTTEQVSLMHQLLASWPVREAVTTNYDTCFEQAWIDAGREHVVLPKVSAQGAEAWLLKLHGSIDDRSRIVLSREDYLRFEGEGVALAGMVQAMLLTRRMLFVGYSLSDDNFHRLVHQRRWRSARSSSDPRRCSAPRSPRSVPGCPRTSGTGHRIPQHGRGTRRGGAADGRRARLRRSAGGGTGRPHAR